MRQGLKSFLPFRRMEARSGQLRETLQTTTLKQDVMDHLYKNGESKLAEIAKALGKTSQEVSNALAQLKSEGQVRQPRRGYYEVAFASDNDLVDLRF